MESKKQSFLTHLEHLRWHLINSLIAILMFTLVCFLNISNIFDRFIFSLLELDFPTYKILCQLSEKFFSDDSLCISSVSLQMQNIELAGQFNMSLLVSFIGGFLLAFPYILWEFWLFIKPGMYSNESKYKIISFCIFYLIYFRYLFLDIIYWLQFQLIFLQIIILVSKLSTILISFLSLN